MERNHGFTLMELCMALAILAVITTLSIGGYQGIREKNNFRALQETASKLALEQQHYRQRYQRYATQIASTGSTNNQVLVLNGIQGYQISVNSTNSRDFTATVRPTDNALLTSNRCRSMRVSSNRGYLRYETLSSTGQNTTGECL